MHHTITWKQCHFVSVPFILISVGLSQCLVGRNINVEFIIDWWQTNHRNLSHGQKSGNPQSRRATKQYSTWFEILLGYWRFVVHFCCSRCTRRSCHQELSLPLEEYHRWEEHWRLSPSTSTPTQRSHEHLTGCTRIQRSMERAKNREQRTTNLTNVVNASNKPRATLGDGQVIRSMERACWVPLVVGLVGVHGCSRHIQIRISREGGQLHAYGFDKHISLKRCHSTPVQHHHVCDENISPTKTKYMYTKMSMSWSRLSMMKR